MPIGVNLTASLAVVDALLGFPFPVGVAEG